MDNVFKKEMESFLLMHHKDQKDKGGETYINHLRFVSSLASSLGEKKCYTKEEIFHLEVLGYCHDLLEDTSCKINDIHSFLKKNGICDSYFFNGCFDNDLNLLTHKKEDSYSFYIANIVINGNLRVAIIKIADLTNNLDTKRFKKVTPKDRERIKKYKCAKWLINDEYKVTNV